MNKPTYKTHLQVVGHQASQRAVTVLKKDELDSVKKKCYRAFMLTWNAKLGGDMTTSRFYSGTSHIKTKEDWDSIRGIYKWCKEKKVPFAPVFKKRWMLNY